MQALRLERRMVHELVQEQQFAEAAVPFAVSIAWEFRDALEPVIAEQPRQWPHSDRVLAWLSPNLKEDIRVFHENIGKQMNEIFAEHQLESLDGSLADILLDKVVKLIPSAGARVAWWKRKLTDHYFQ